MPKQCKETNRQGKRCKAWAVNGETKCHLHSQPGKAAQLGVKGGHRRKMLPAADPGTVVPPETATDVRKLLARSMADVLTGKLDPRLANAAGYLGTAFLRAVEVADIEPQLAELKAKLEILHVTQKQYKQA
jgi:hypothetical protein